MGRSLFPQRYYPGTVLCLSLGKYLLFLCWILESYKGFHCRAFCFYTSLSLWGVHFLVLYSFFYECCDVPERKKLNFCVCVGKFLIIGRYGSENEVWRFFNGFFRSGVVCGDVEVEFVRFLGQIWMAGKLGSQRFLMLEVSFWLRKVTRSCVLGCFDWFGIWVVLSYGCIRVFMLKIFWKFCFV